MSAPVRMTAASNSLLAYAVTGTLAVAVSGITIAASQHPQIGLSEKGKSPPILSETAIAPPPEDARYRALVAGALSLQTTQYIVEAPAPAPRTAARSALPIPPPHYKQHRVVSHNAARHAAVPPAHYRITNQQRAAETTATDALNRAELASLK